jgi:RHS repeat-associated protein
VWGTGNQLSEFTPGSGGGMVLAHTNVWANGVLIATDDVNKTHFYLNDWLGTRRVQTDYAGTLEQTCASLPYGDGEACGAPPSGNLYTGKERDSESGNDYFGARYYASTVGRFLSPDWAAKAEPVPYAKLGDPQSLNLYEYVGNDPLGRVDADGHCFEDGCAIEGTVAAVGVAVYTLAIATRAYLETPSGQRSLDTFTSAASASFSHSVHSIRNFFSRSKSGGGKTAAPAAAPDTTPAPLPAPGFVGDAGGNVVRIPPGSTARPANNRNGVVYQPPVPAGAHPDSDAVRVMGPHAHQPTGSIVVHGPDGRPINPATGKPDTKPNTHTPIRPTPNPSNT